MTTTPKESVLSCVSLQQAQNVVDYLFSKKLISRAEILPTNVENEVKIIFENLEENFQQLQQEITALMGRENALLHI